MSNKYLPEYKAEAVKLWLESGRKGKEVGRKLGIDPTLFLKWYRTLNGEATRPVRRLITQAQGSSTSPATSGLVVENARLRRENERLRIEHEILKKTVNFIAGITK